MTFTLGAIPKQMEVELSSGADFIQTMHTETGDPWPVGTAVELRFSDGTTWAATITTNQIAWNVDKADVATLIATHAKNAQLFYVNGTVDLLWASGRVKVRA